MTNAKNDPMHMLLTEDEMQEGKKILKLKMKTPDHMKQMVAGLDSQFYIRKVNGEEIWNVNNAGHSSFVSVTQIDTVLNSAEERIMYRFPGDDMGRAVTGQDVWGMWVRGDTPEAIAFFEETGITIAIADDLLSGDIGIMNIIFDRSNINNANPEVNIGDLRNHGDVLGEISKFDQYTVTQVLLNLQMYINMRGRHGFAEIVSEGGSKVVRWAEGIPKGGTMARFDGYMATQLTQEEYEIWVHHYRDKSVYDTWGDTLLYIDSHGNPVRISDFDDMIGEQGVSSIIKDDVIYRDLRELLTYNFLYPVQAIKKTIFLSLNIGRINPALTMPWEAVIKHGTTTLPLAGIIVFVNNVKLVTLWEVSSTRLKGITNIGVNELSAGLNRWLGGADGESNQLLPFIKNGLEDTISKVLKGIWDLKGKVSRYENFISPFYWLRHQEGAAITSVATSSKGMWDAFVEMIGKWI